MSLLSNNIFESISEIQTPFQLIAFVLAILMIVLIAFFKREKKILHNIKNKDQSDVIDRYLNIFSNKDIEGLTKKQKFELIKSSVEHRIKRLKILSLTFILVIITIAGIYGMTNINETKLWKRNQTKEKLKEIPEIEATIKNYQLELSDLLNALKYSTDDFKNLNFVCDTNREKLLIESIHLYNDSFEKYYNSRDAIIASVNHYWKESENEIERIDALILDRIHDFYVIRINEEFMAINAIDCNEQNEAPKKIVVKIIENLKNTYDDAVILNSELDREIVELFTNIKTNIKR